MIGQVLLMLYIFGATSIAMRSVREDDGFMAIPIALLWPLFLLSAIFNTVYHFTWKTNRFI